MEWTSHNTWQQTTPQQQHRGSTATTTATTTTTTAPAIPNQNTILALGALSSIDLMTSKIGKNIFTAPCGSVNLLFVAVAFARFDMFPIYVCYKYVVEMSRTWNWDTFYSLYFIFDFRLSFSMQVAIHSCNQQKTTLSVSLFLSRNLSSSFFFSHCLPLSCTWADQVDRFLRIKSSWSALNEGQVWLYWVIRAWHRTPPWGNKTINASINTADTAGHS